MGGKSRMLYMLRPLISLFPEIQKPEKRVKVCNLGDVQRQVDLDFYFAVDLPGELSNPFVRDHKEHWV